MRTAVVFLNFGEPQQPTLQEVVPFLERIFLTNAVLEGATTEAARRERAHELAVRRAPGLIAEYETIGGSPLSQQATQQAEAVTHALRARGHDAHGYVGMQFTEPSIEKAVERAHVEGADLVVGFAVYPICGPSTNVAALAQLRRAVETLGWSVPLREISGWHSHTAYLELRTDAIRNFAIEHELDLSDPTTRLVFSAHGTPMEYLKQGSRYVLYTEHVCHTIAESLGLHEYELGYQNHSNRPIEWTQPGIETVIESVQAKTIVVDACSFMHEQSETLAELDHDVKAAAEARGIAYHRVPIPHDAPAFIKLMADLIEPFIAGEPEAAGFRPCRCRPTPDTFCLNTVL
jgi:protoporphyrin/coproporphyrin ferrochelatase